MDRTQPVHFERGESAAWPRVRAFRSNYRAAAALFFFLVMGSVWATRAVAQDGESKESIHGTVINALTREPIGRALVLSSDNRFARLTDSEGRFEYPVPKAIADEARQARMEGREQPQFVSCCLMARKPGFLSEPNHGAEVGILLGSEPIIALMPEGLIKGRVSLQSSDAASGIAVEIFSRQAQDGTFHWRRTDTVRANSNGEFRFAELPAGEYKIVTRELMDPDPATMFRGRQLFGYPPVYFPGAVDFNSASPVQLKAGQTFEADLAPVRQPYYAVYIPVANGVANGRITVSIQGHDSPGYSLGYRSEQQSITGFLPNGTYVVTMESFQQPKGASGSVTVTVSGGTAHGPSIVLSPHSSIQLNVGEDFTANEENRTATFTNEKRTFNLHGPRLDLQASVEPLADLDFPGGRSIRPPTGPDDDSLVIDDVAPGRYRLRLFASRGYAASATAGGVDLLQEPLVVSSASSITVEVRLRDDFAEVDGSISNMGTAFRGSAQPGVSGPWRSAFIYFVPQPGATGQFQQIGTDDEGKFGGANVAPGKYLVLAFDKPQNDLPWRDADAMRAYEAKGRTVQLVPGQKVKLELQIVSGAEEKR